MKNKIFLLFFSLAFLVFLVFPLFPSNTAHATNKTAREELLRQIKIFKHEISLLQMLYSNMQLREEINAQSYLAVNLSDNSVLLEKNSAQPFPIASITKLMSAVIALENFNKNQAITLTEEMLKPLGHSPCLFSGLNVSIDNLLKASLIQSTNDASEALAISLGKEKFLSLMNQKAKELGMANTVFYDAHGLNQKNHSSAQDLAKLLSYINKNHPEILKTSKDNNFWLPDSKGTLLKFQNVNNFYYFSSFIGGKTGYLPEARQTSASVFNVNNSSVAIIVLYSRNRQADTFAILRKIKSRVPKDKARDESKAFSEH